MREAAIKLANVLQESLILLPSAKPEIPLITIHSMFRSCAAAYTPKYEFFLGGKERSGVKS